MAENPRNPQANQPTQQNPKQAPQPTAKSTPVPPSVEAPQTKIETPNFGNPYSEEKK